LVLFSPIIIFIKDIYSQFLRDYFDIWIAKALSIDLTFLSFLMVYVFFICGLILLSIVYWLGWDNLRFKVKQMKYRSALMAKDYYKEDRRIHYDSFVGDINRFSDGKLDLSGKEQEEGKLANLDNDQRAALSQVIAFKDGKLEGTFRSYFVNGKIESEVTYREGKLNGPYRTFYPDGRLRAERFYNEGKINGIFRAFDEDGSIFFEISYYDGKQNGPDKTFYRSGVLQYLDIYKDGKRLHRKTYDEQGNLRFEQDFS